MRQLCAFRSPEDLADVRGSPWILISQQDPEIGDSGLAALDARSSTVVRYAPADLRKSDTRDGDPACTTPPAKLKPGGIGVRADGGGYHLVVINRVGPDRVEFFRVRLESDRPRLEWAGCLILPTALFLNDIAPMPDQGFVATHMFDRGQAARDPAELRRRFLAGLPTGYVVRWSPHSGLRILPGSEGSFPNGVDASADGETVYFAETYGHRVNAMSSAGGAPRRIPVSMQPDNVTVDEDGAIIVAGGTGAPVTSTENCASLRSVGCGFPSAVDRIEPLSGRRTRLFADDGAAVPGASVGLIKNKRLYLGTSFGDRITEVDLVTLPP